MTDFMSGIVPVQSQIPNVIAWNEFHAEMRNHRTRNTTLWVRGISEVDILLGSKKYPAIS